MMRVSIAAVLAGGSNVMLIMACSAQTRHSDQQADQQYGEESLHSLQHVGAFLRQLVPPVEHIDSLHSFLYYPGRIFLLLRSWLSNLLWLVKTARTKGLVLN
jgi:hypothetical protein